MAHPTDRKWVVTLVGNGISRVSPPTTGVITHLLSEMNHPHLWDPKIMQDPLRVILCHLPDPIGVGEKRQMVVKHVRADVQFLRRRAPRAYKRDLVM